MSEKDDSNPGERFDESERITSNLRLQSISPAGRTLLGALALIPPKWRGPVVLFAFALIGFLVGSKAPALIRWIESK